MTRKPKAWFVDQRPPDADDLAGPDDPERARRLIWADLMKRAYAQDVLVCRRCSGEMWVVGVIFDPAVAERILRYLGLWQRGPPRGRRVVIEPADHGTPDGN